MSETQNYFYLRLKENFFDSDSMILLENMKDGYIYANILLKLYLRSLKNGGRLMLNDTIPYNPEMLASVTRHSVGDIEKALRIFKDLNLIEILDTGAIYITDIQSFIGKSTTEADRKRKYREIIELEKKAPIMLNGTNAQTNVQTNVGQMSDKYPPYKSKEDLEIDIEIYKNIVGYLNQQAGTGYRYQSEKTKGLIRARLNEGFTEEDFITVIDNKVEEWKQDKKFSKFLRPETLFSNKFEGYLNEKHGQQQTDKPLSMSEMQKAALQMARKKEGRK